MTDFPHTRRALNEEARHVTINPEALADTQEEGRRRLPEAARLAQCVVELQEAQHDVADLKARILELQQSLDQHEEHLEGRRMAVREAYDLLDVALRDIDPQVLPPNARKA